MKTIQLSSIILFVILQATVVMGHDNSSSSMTAKFEDLSGEKLEAQFLKEMIKHHQVAVNMAEIAKDRSNHDELSRFSKEIIEKQQKEIKQMNGWLSSWYGEKQDDHSMESKDQQMINKLKNADKESFDQIFLSEMVKHHQEAIDMTSKVQKKTKRDELRHFQKSLIQDQSKEIDQMKDWQKNWK